MKEMHQSPIMELRDVQVGYQAAPVRQDFAYGPVSLSLRAGEMIAVIGRNGVGKSTLLRTLACLQPPLKGSIRLMGRDVAGISRPDISRMIGFVSTEVIGIQNMRVYELVSIGRHPHTRWMGRLRKEDHERISYALAQSGIHDIRMKFLHQLSDGERQKAMIARVLAQDTPVIVLDEPTAFLDLPSRYEVVRLMNDLADSGGKTILFSTHDLDIARNEADKLWLMTPEGIAEGAPEDLLFSRLFHKLFLNSHVEYNEQADGFRLKKDLRWRINLKGDSKYLHLTQKALERIGFQWTETETGETGIEVGSNSDKPVWWLREGSERKAFTSIYDLATHLKNHKP